MHLVYAKSLKEKVKKLKGKSEEEDEEDIDEDEIEEESAEDEEEIEEESAEDEEEEFKDDGGEEFEDDDEGDEGIDIGDWVWLELDGKEYYGEIVEFNDDEGTVTIETEDDEEITGDQNDMFIDE